jgi:hypothetical protein
LADAAMEGKKIPDAENPNFLNRLAENWRTRAFYMVTNKMIDRDGQVMGPGLKEIMQEVEGKESDFAGYAVARWAVEKAEQAKETGVEIDAARQVLELYPEFKGTFDNLVEWQNGTLRYAHSGGLVSDEVLEKVIAENKARIPGYRADEEEHAGPTGGGKTTRSVVKEFFGSKRKIKPIFQSLVQDAMRRVQYAEQNRATLALADLAESIGEAKRVGGPRNLRGTEDPALWIDHDIDPDALGWESLGIPGDEGANPARRDASKWAAVQGLKGDEVPVFRQGQMERWKFDDPNVVRYLRGYDNQSLSVLQKVLSGMTRFTRAAIVNNPLFAAHLAGYDVVWQFIKTPGYRNTLADLVTGLGHGLLSRLGEVAGGEPSALWDSWLRSGGAESAFHDMARDPYIMDLLKTGGDPTIADRVWNTIKSPFHEIKVYSQLIMDAQKAVRYTRGVGQGESGIRAAVASSEAAFHRAGFGGAILRAFNMVQPFTGAILNGLEQVTRGQLGLGKMITGEPRDAINFTLKAAAVITTPMVLTWAMNREEEWYKAMPQWQRDNGLPIHMENGTTAYWRYPPLVSLLYGGIPLRLLEAFAKDNPRAMEGIKKSLFDAAIPPVGVQAFGPMTPIIEHVANYSFFREDNLVPDNLVKSTLPAYRYGPSSTEVAKLVSRFTSDLPLLKDMSLSAPVVDNYIQQWTGTLGAGAIRFMEGALQKAGVIETKAASKNITDIPGFSSYIVHYPSGNAAPIREFEDRMTAWPAVIKPAAMRSGILSGTG